MLDYLMARLREALPHDWPHLLGVSALGPLLDAIWRHWMDFPLSNPVLCVCTVWWADWLAGSAVAWRAHNWEPRRAARSVGKLLLWLIMLGIAHEFRRSEVWGMGAAAGAIEAAILLAEGSSVFRNLALLSPSIDQAKLLARYADVTQKKSLKFATNKGDNDDRQDSKHSG